MLLILLTAIGFSVSVTSVFYLLRGGKWEGHIVYSLLIFLGFVLAGYIQNHSDKTLLGLQPLVWFVGIILVGTLLNIAFSDKD